MSSTELRDKILTEPIGIVYAMGPRHVTMRALAEKLGYSAATIYLRFKNEEERIREIGLHGYDRLAEAVAPALEIAEPAAAVADGARGYVEFGLQRYELYCLMFRDIPPYEDRAPDEMARPACARHRARPLSARTSASARCSAERPPAFRNGGLRALLRVAPGRPRDRRRMGFPP